MLVVISVLLFLILCAITGTLPLLGIALAIIIPIGIIGLICSWIESWNRDVENKWRLTEWDGFNPIGDMFLNIERNNKRELIQYKVYQNNNRLKYEQIKPSLNISRDSDSWLVLHNSDIWEEIRLAVINNKSFQITLPCRFLFISFKPIKVTGSYLRHLTTEERIEQIQKNRNITSIPKGHWPASEDV